MRIVLTVLFEAPFWIAIFEREELGKISVARVVFGSEPTSPELLSWLLTHYSNLEFSQVSMATLHQSRVVNPKRATREAKRSALNTGVSSAAADVMRLELERRKLERRVVSKEEREAEAERQYQIHRAKAKARHRGK